MSPCLLLKYLESLGTLPELLSLLLEVVWIERGLAASEDVVSVSPKVGRKLTFQSEDGRGLKSTCRRTLGSILIFNPTHVHCGIVSTFGAKRPCDNHLAVLDIGITTV